MNAEVEEAPKRTLNTDKIPEAEIIQDDKEQTTGTSATLLEEPKKPPVVKVDLLEDDYTNSILSAQAKPFAPTDDEDEANNNLNQSSQSNTGQANSQPDATALSAHDLRDVAQFMMEMLDTGVSMICCSISGESSSNQFEIPAHKKSQLGSQLSNILAKYQIKMSLEWLFLISLAIVFAEPVKRAFNIKKRKQKEDDYDTDGATQDNGFQHSESHQEPPRKAGRPKKNG